MFRDSTLQALATAALCRPTEEPQSLLLDGTVDPSAVGWFESESNSLQLNFGGGTMQRNFGLHKRPPRLFGMWTVKYAPV